MTLALRGAATSASPRTPADGLVPLLASRGSAPTLIDDDGTVTYAELAERVRRRRDAYPHVGTGRRVVGLAAANTVTFLVDHLAALAAGHAVLLLPADPVARAALVGSWQPDVLAGGGEPVPAHAHDSSPRHRLHPDLALLLSTSGSTGSPKLVRLSHRALLANARSIVDYLGIVADDRAVTTLPPHYCYGLSVLHSHLLAGASVVLTGESVGGTAFWDRARETGVTTLAGVPHTYETIDRRGAELLDALPRLRYVTQAGGRLDPATIRRLAARLSARGADFVVMYGQTEATARMGYLPAHLAESRPEAVGVAIPGGRFRVDPRPGAGPGEPGELVYSGPNVMMGYARQGTDLARGAELTELRTGDLARVADDGLIEVVGRLGREVKIFGSRIDLGRVEAVLAERGGRAWCVGEPDRLVVVTEGPTRAGAGGEDGDGDHADFTDDTVRAAAAAASGLPAAVVDHVAVAAVPRTEAGKVDHRALAEAVRRRDTTVDGGMGDVGTAADGSVAGGAVHGGAVAGGAAASRARRLTTTTPSAVVADALRVPASGDDTFVDLGGDSLTYVVVSSRLEALVDRLPRDWHLRPLAELDARAAAFGQPTADPATADLDEPAPRRRPAPRWCPPGSWARIDTGVLLRAVFILTVVGTHTRALTIVGGAHVLVALAGHSLARFRLHDPRPGRRAAGILRSAARIAVPALVWLALVTPWTSRYHWYSPLLLTNVLGPHSWWADRWWNPWQMWFVEAVVYAVALTAAVMAVPAVTRADLRWPFLAPGAVVAAGLTVRFGLVDLGGGPQVWYSAPAVAWLFGLGWAVARCRTWWQRGLCSVVALVAVPGWFGDPGREAVILAGLGLLTWLPTITVPTALVRVATPLAAASLYVYLTHFLVYPPIRDAGHEWLSAAVSVAVGLAAWRLWEGPVVGAAERVWARRRPRGSDRGAVASTRPPGVASPGRPERGGTSCASPPPRS